MPELTLQDHIAISNLAFDWVESYDLKDWPRLRSLLAPSIRMDFRSFHGELHDSLTPDEYVAILSDVKLIGDPRLKTQHLIGGTKIEMLDADTIQAAIQLRVAHQRYVDEDMKEVKNKGHAHGVANHVYKRVDGEWKIASVTPRVEWAEYDLYGTLAG